MRKTDLFIWIAAIPGLMLTTQAIAQGMTPQWQPNRETITVSAMANKGVDLRSALTGTHFTEAYAVSASIPVPYSDLNLSREVDSQELNRRIGVAAQLVCEELDAKYPAARYPVLLGPSGDDCTQGAKSDALAKAALLIADARK